MGGGGGSGKGTDGDASCPPPRTGGTEQGGGKGWDPGTTTNNQKIEGAQDVLAILIMGGDVE